mgnify:CR=1 FL=1
MTKILYLKTLCKTPKAKLKITKQLKEALLSLNGIDDTYAKKEVNPNAYRDFILSNTKDFLEHAVDYSVNEHLCSYLKDLK